jgi:hypothetical protein
MECASACVCYYHSSDKPFGFLRHWMNGADGALEEETIYFYDNSLPQHRDPSRPAESHRRL